MLRAKRTLFSPKGVGFDYVLHQSYNRTIYPLNRKLICDKSSDVELRKANFQVQLRGLHLTVVNRDLETGLKAVGCGLAASGLIGAGIGTGLVFQGLNGAMARNPSLAKKLFANAVMGAAFCEALGLFAVMISFMILL